MCLSTVTDPYAKSKIIHSGYKEFSGSGKSLSFQSYSMKGGPAVPLDTWIKAEGPASISATDGKTYPAYFHIYDSNKESKKNKNRVLVYFRGLRAVGTQGNETCFIAQEMYVPSSPNSWPPIQPKLATPQKDSTTKVIIEKLSSLIDDLKKTAGNA